MLTLMDGCLRHIAIMMFIEEFKYLYTDGRISALLVRGNGKCKIEDLERIKLVHMESTSAAIDRKNCLLGKIYREAFHLQIKVEIQNLGTENIVDHTEVFIFFSQKAGDKQSMCVAGLSAREEPGSSDTS